MADFGFDSDPFASLQGSSSGRHSKNSSSRSKEGSHSRSCKPSSSGGVSSSRERDRDRGSRERDLKEHREKDRDREKERKHRTSKDRDRERERSSDRDRHHSKSSEHHSHISSNAFEPSFAGFRQEDAANAFGYETHAPSSKSGVPSPQPESRMRRMRRASVTAGTTGGSGGASVSGDSTAESLEAPAGRVRRPRRASLVGDTAGLSSGAAPSNRRILQATRSSDGLEDMRHNLRSGLPEGHNVAPKRRGRRASLVAGSGGVSVRNIAGEMAVDDYGYGDSDDYGYNDESAPTTAADQEFLEERTDRQRKLLDKFRNMDVHADDDASVMSPRKETPSVTVSAVRTDLMLQTTQQPQPRTRRRASLIGALSGVVGGGVSTTPEPIKDEPERKSGRDRRSMRSKSASGDLMVSYDPTRERTRGAGLLDRVGAARPGTERSSSGAGTGTSYSDRILQGR